MRAARMGLSGAPVQLGAATCVEDILATLEARPAPGIVAIDSIQTIWTSALEAAPGTIAQVRTASFDLVRYAKASGAALLLVGHVTKEGQIAGPKAVEHLVDAVLYFEGERGHHFRVLRAVKNRFGADRRDRRVRNDRARASPKSPILRRCFWATATARRPVPRCSPGSKARGPLLVEIQALVAAAGYGTPRRAVVGWDTGRLAMILAVLDARAGLGIGGSRCLSECRRRPEDRRAGRRSGGGGGAGFVLRRRAVAARNACSSAKSAFRAMFARRRRPSCG